MLLSGGLARRQRLEFHEPVPLADVDEQRCGVLAAGEVQRAAFLAVEACDLPRVQDQADPRGGERQAPTVPAPAMRGIQFDGVFPAFDFAVVLTLFIVVSSSQLSARRAALRAC